MASNRGEDLEDLEGLCVRDLVAALSQVEDQRRRARGEASERPGGSSPAEAGLAALAGREARILRELRRRARARQQQQRRGRDARR